jgi:hypothetical protein
MAGQRHHDGRALQRKAAYLMIFRKERRREVKRKRRREGRRERMHARDQGQDISFKDVLPVTYFLN